MQTCKCGYTHFANEQCHTLADQAEIALETLTEQISDPKNNDTARLMAVLNPTGKEGRL
jgi:hypothetical protein